MASSSDFQLVCELVGHGGDVRSLCVLNEDSSARTGSTLVSGSRDRLVKLWRSNTEGTQFSEQATVPDHEHWVAALMDLSPRTTLVPLVGLAAELQGGFATGCQDNKIRLFSRSGQLMRTLTGHTGAVTSLSVSAEGLLLSGSWDSSAKAWDLRKPAGTECVATMDGHENGVCVLGLPNGDIVTGSAGVQEGNSIRGYQIRLWHEYTKVAEAKEHTGAVRSVCLLDIESGTFASASNDGTVRVYDSKAQLLQTMTNPPGPEGSPAFNFGVSSLGNGIVIASCDDCCARIWDVASGQLVQELAHPCTVWMACVLPNGDLATAGSDSLVRVFSKDPSRVADLDTLQVYSAVATAARDALNKKESKVDVSKLCKIENATPGTSEGQVKMFAFAGQAWVYQWSAISSTWVQVGEVMGDAGAQEELDGKLYDKVLPVELEDPATGGIRKLKLGFNNGDNPFLVAQRFVETNGLPEHYTQEIATFISNNRNPNVPTIDASGAPPAAGASSAMDVDAYAYGVSSSSARAASSSTKALPYSFFPLPSAKGLAFESIKIDAVLSKLTEFNFDSTNQAPLDAEALEALKGVGATLKRTSHFHSSTFSSAELSALHRIVVTWDPKFVFPALDLLRVGVTHPVVADYYSMAGKGEALTTHVLELMSANSDSLPIVLLGLRVLTNMFTHACSRAAVLSALSQSEGERIKALVQYTDHDKRTVRLSLATLMLNVANAAYHEQKSVLKGGTERAVESVCVSLILNKHSDEDTMVRAAMALGAMTCAGYPPAELSALDAAPVERESRLPDCLSELRAAVRDMPRQ